MAKKKKEKKKEREGKRERRKNLKKIERDRKILNRISIVIVLFSLLAISILVVNIPLEPKQGTNTTSTSISLKWLGFASRAIVDDNREFSSPIVVEKNKSAVLEPGTYYWKTEGMSPVNTFTIDSVIALSIQDDNNARIIKNMGNVKILLEMFKSMGLTGQAVLNLNETLALNASNDTKIIASQQP